MRPTQPTVRRDRKGNNLLDEVAFATVRRPHFPAGRKGIALVQSRRSSVMRRKRLVRRWDGQRSRRRMRPGVHDHQRTFIPVGDRLIRWFKKRRGQVPIAHRHRLMGRRCWRRRLRVCYVCEELFELDVRVGPDVHYTVVVFDVHRGVRVLPHRCPPKSTRHTRSFLELQSLKTDSLNCCQNIYTQVARYCNTVVVRAERDVRQVPWDSFPWRPAQ